MTPATTLDEVLALRSENARLRERIAELQAQWGYTESIQTIKIERLQAAGERVVWFDWSGNDPDAVAAVYALRQELVASRVEQGADGQ